MPVEIEVKIRVPDHDATRARLEELGASFEKRTRETNVFFDTPDHALAAKDEGLRLRTNRDADTGEESFVITYKGPRRPGAAKSREEIELTVDDPTSAAALFEKLGYVNELSFEKRRETWSLDGCKVELDEVPHLGKFVEVEGPDEPRVMDVRGRLGLGDEPTIKTGYISMLVEYLRGRGMPADDVTFAGQ